ncbi:hypothetical protein E2C01_050322 [Portunus trituberculatus]|uniref:Uncharacterized protein n=1 Tax=Portunus trituberculatus TaxID=210409 RepID=A0A5B7GIL7_PORTR|nr:hypothetical protein [Portunus trituberculatus]
MEKHYNIRIQGKLQEATRDTCSVGLPQRDCYFQWIFLNRTSSKEELSVRWVWLSLLLVLKLTDFYHPSLSLSDQYRGDYKPGHVLSEVYLSVMSPGTLSVVMSLQT